jgi:hypothetical protein
VDIFARGENGFYQSVQSRRVTGDFRFKFQSGVALEDEVDLQKRASNQCRC